MTMQRGAARKNTPMNCDGKPIRPYNQSIALVWARRFRPKRSGDRKFSTRLSRKTLALRDAAFKGITEKAHAGDLK